MVVGDGIEYADVFARLEPLASKLGRSVNPTVYTRTDWARRVKQGNAFVARVLKAPRVWVIGSEDELGT